MALLTPTTSYRHVIGDLVEHFYNFTGVNGDTFVPPNGNIRQVIITPTTAIAMGATVTGNTVTFVSGGAWTAKVCIVSRTG